ncbi:unnamed protein product [Rotaria magnacalcarata]|uniref:HAT C-terminal dimerisation domain-containing protein n=2 Tax=Rotaria magnacalcarata TaxID=392030 RepID=A0A815R8X5_9BILA|nr:unnamed protein product [Rotaria magnacalcarata]
MVSKLLTRTQLEQLFKKNDTSIALKKAQTNRACSTGTGGLKKHLASCDKNTLSNATQSTITTYYTTSKPSIIPEKIKKEVTNAYLEFIALDGRPFEIVSRIGFKNMLETVFKAGKITANSQSTEISDLLPHPTTVSRKIDQVYSFRKKQLNEWCKPINSYVVCGATVREIDENFYLHSFSLGCKPYTPANQTAPNVRKFIDDLLLDYGLSLNTNSFIVTDNEPKMLAALRGANRVGCSDHYINKALEHAFTSPKSNCVEVIQVFDIVRSLVENFRRCHRQIKLSRKLQTFSVTRFSGAYYMLNVFNITYNELVDAFSGSHYNDFESLDKDLLYHFCEFLRSFDEVITTLSEETQPTLHKVIPLRCFLINHCTPKPDDISGMMKIKLFLQERIMDKWPIQSEHLLATLLHPRLRDFSGDQALKDRAIELLQSSISSSADSSSNNTSSCNSSLSSSVDNSITPKKTNILSLCYDKPRAIKPALDEIMLWLQSDFSKDFINDDLLLFWRRDKDDFPSIAKIARKVLAIPVANTSVERLFSSTKITIGDRRTRLGAAKIDKRMFLQKNLIPLKNMFDSKNVLTTNELKRKPDNIHEQDDDSDHYASKKLKVIEIDEYMFSSDDCENDDYESEKENW